LSIQVDVSPSYETKPKIGRKGIIVLDALLVIGILLLPIVSTKEASLYMTLLVSFLIAIPVGFAIFLQRAKGGKGTLTQFINSISNLIIHWALVRASLGEYNACCELSNGYYVSFEQNLSRHSGYKAVLLSVSKFITRPESVSKAPLSKWGWDNRTLKPTILPFRDKDIESWKKSDEKWKRLVSEDEAIRSWMAQNCNWKNLQYAPTSRGIYSIAMLAYYGYQRNPSIRDGWLKGKWLTIDFIFRIPTTFDANKLRNFYLEMIDIGKRIIEHIEEDRSLVSSTGNNR
jgi:hypothetical protein